MRTYENYSSAENQFLAVFLQYNDILYQHWREKLYRRRTELENGSGEEGDSDFIIIMPEEDEEYIP